MMLDKDKLLYDLFQAYYDARKHKRNKNTAISFEMNYESKLITLWQELVDGTYNIGPNICFVIKDPVQREVFAADFRDRIVHHLIYNYIYEMFDCNFIYDSYSCRLGKGTHFGVQRVKKIMRSCSDNYTKTGYIIKMDIKGFFMSIDKDILFQKIEYFLQSKRGNLNIDYDFIIKLIHQIIFHNPTKNCIIRLSKDDRIGLPKDKSLFSSGENIGLAIGNLTSQLFANVYLDIFDKYVKYKLGFSYYGRYVDDFIIIHSEKEKLLQSIPKIRKNLAENLKLTLHPNKIYLQKINKGVLFLGAYIKPYRSYVRKRTIGKFYQKIQKMNMITDKTKIQSTVNSYLGILSHHKSYRITKKLFSKYGKHICCTFCPVDNYRKICPIVRTLKSSELNKLYHQGYCNGNLR